MRLGQINYGLQLGTICCASSIYRQSSVKTVKTLFKLQVNNFIDELQLKEGGRLNLI